MKNFKKLICITDDGSSTIFLPDFNEYYHSKHGAVSESEHVFIKNGLKFWLKNNPNKEYCNIFEVGFGTGLNALLTYKESKLIPNTSKPVSNTRRWIYINSKARSIDLCMLRKDMSKRSQCRKLSSC